MVLPGQVDLSDGESFRSGFPHEFFRYLRDNEPVYWHEPTGHTSDGEGFWVVSRYEDAVYVMRQPRIFSSDKGGMRTAGGTSLKDEPSAGLMLNQTDNPHHRRLRELVQRGFTTRAIAKLEHELRQMTRKLLDAVGDQAVFDFVPAVARELPAQAICMILGVPQADRSRLVDMVDGGVENSEGVIIAHDTLRALGAYGIELVEEKRAKPTDDILSTIVHARLDGYDPPQLSDRELRYFFNLLFPAGAETTRSALGGAVKAFHDFPEQWARLGADPALMKSAVEEILRWTTPSVYKRRTATRDTKLCGVAVAAGDKVSYWELSANRDEREFPEPFAFDIARRPNRHVAFGAGVHFCLGSQLARLEIRVVLEELLARYASIEVVGEPQWMPNNRLVGLKHLPVKAVPHSVPRPVQ